MEKVIHWLSQFGELIDAIVGIITLGFWSFNFGLKIEYHLSQRRLARINRRFERA